MYNPFLIVCNICQNILKVDEEHQLEIVKIHIRENYNLKKKMKFSNFYF